MSSALQEYKVQVKPTPSLFSIYMGKPVMQFTVWVNGKQNSEKVNFLPEQRSPICTNQFHLRENGCESLKLA